MITVLRTTVTTLSLVLGVTSTSVWAEPFEDDYRYVGADVNGTSLHVLRSDWMKIFSHTTAGPLWVWFDHSSDATTSARYSMARMIINCTDFSYKVSTTATYAPSGVTIEDKYPEVYSWTYAVPNSAIYSIFEDTCTPMGE